MQSPLRTIPPITKQNNRYIYPATPTLLKNLNIDTNILNKWLEIRKNKFKINIDCDNRLREYQIEGIKKIIKLKRCGIFDQQRLGKTPMVLSSLNFLKPKSTIIIVPKSLLLSWKDECIKWYTDDVVIIKGTPKQRQKLYKEKHKVMIMSYAMVSLDENYITAPECLIIDEAHRMRNFKSMHSKYSPITIKEIMKLSYKVPIKLALTGTPAPNKPENIFAILHFLYPNIYKSFYNFQDYYFKTEEVYIGENKTITEITGFQPNKDKELQEFLDYISLQRKRKDYMDWIPKVDKKSIYITLEKNEKKWYNDIVHTYESKELDINCSNELSQMIALRKIVAKAKQKEQFILDYISDYPEESIIIVSEFTSYLSQLYDILKLNNITSRLIIGKCNETYRKQAQDDFNDKKYNILLANIECIKEGMKLEQASTIIVLDPSLTYTDNEQLEDRFLPTTKEKALQKDKQQIIYLLAKETIDIYIREQLNNKKEKVDIINNFKKYITNTTIQ